MKSPANRNLAHLRAASYNPRLISEKQLASLRNSYVKYGDLSGVIFNRRTKTLIGGHQRTTIFRQAKNARVISRPFKDGVGTVAIGYVEIPLKSGKLLRIPYREVNVDPLTEKAMNLAANAGGGEFDYPKVGAILKELEQGQFSIESIPLEDLERERAIRNFEYLNMKTPTPGPETSKRHKFDPNEHWQGMPEFESENQLSHRSIIVHFKSERDVRKFSALVRQNLGEKVKSIWFPKAKIETYADKAYVATKQKGGR